MTESGGETAPLRNPSGHSRPLRVGLVCPYSWDFPGGVKTHVHDLAEALIARGHDVSVLAPADDDDGLPHYVVPAGRAVPIPYNGSVARLAFGPLSARRVRRWIAEHDFDVLHVHEPAAPSVSIIACWAAVGPMVGTFHTSNPRSRAMAATANVLHTALEKLSARIAVSEPARATLIEHLGGDAVVIPNGVDVRHYRAAVPSARWAGDGPTVGFLGRLDEPRKGFAVLTAAMPAIVAAHPDVRFLVMGPGDPDDAMATLPSDVAARVEILGRVSDDEKAAVLASSDVFVAPNTGGESFGIVLLEAMAAGSAVVASDLDAFVRVLEGGASGRLFPVGDAEALAASTIALIDDPQERKRLIAEGAETADRYDWGRVVDQVLAVYETVTAEGLQVREDATGTALGRLTRLGRGPQR
jgi:phosphatidyl-myo-inositol alpha-mannosyltransferase